MGLNEIRNLRNYIKYFYLMLLFFISYESEAQVWRVLGSGLNADSVIYSVTADRKGNIYAIGAFTDGTGQPYVAKWDGTNWSQQGNIFPNHGIYSIVTDKAGNVYVGGDFITSGNYFIAKWDGTSWTKLQCQSGLINGYIETLAIDTFDNLYAIGGFNYVVKWTGSDWIQLGTGSNGLNPNHDIYTITTDNAGNVYVAGRFTFTTNPPDFYYVAKWDGYSWSALGDNITGNALVAYQGMFGLVALATDKYGHVYVTGDVYDNYGNSVVMEWDGSSWFEVGGLNTGFGVGNGETIYSLLTDTSGNLYVGICTPEFSEPTAFAVKWDGTQWANVGVDIPFPDDDLNSFGADADAIYGIALDSWGNIYAVGDISDSSQHWYVAVIGDKGCKLNPPVLDRHNKEVCIYQGESYQAGGALQTQSGLYSDTIRSVCNCDSVITKTDLSVILPEYRFRTVDSCFSAFVNGKHYQDSTVIADTLKSIGGCDSIISTDTLIILKPSISIVSASSLPVIQGDSAQLYISPISVYHNVLWTIAGGQSVDSTAIIYVSPDKNTKYSVSVIDSDFCEISATYDLEIKDGFVMPNAFSPNNDGVNDTFKPVVHNPTSIQVANLLIYNRWGEKVYDMATDGSNGWNGRFRNEYQAAGVYLYFVTFKSRQGTEFSRKGAFNLIY